MLDSLIILFFLGIIMSINYDNPSHSMYSSLCTISSMFCLTQVVTGYTHVHHDGSESTIDLVYVAAASMIKTCDTISPLSNSDHQGILIELNIKPANCDKSQGRLIWRYSHADWNRACELIEA